VPQLQLHTDTVLTTPSYSRELQVAPLSVLKPMPRSESDKLNGHISRKTCFRHIKLPTVIPAVKLLFSITHKMIFYVDFPKFAHKGCPIDQIGIQQHARVSTANEVLAIIFEAGHQYAINVSHVDRRWRYIATRLPSLWRNIHLPRQSPDDNGASASFTISQSYNHH
jgi:hypothetical protein